MQWKKREFLYFFSTVWFLDSSRSFIFLELSAIWIAYVVRWISASSILLRRSSIALFTFYCIFKGSLTYRFCPWETSYVRFSGDPPPPPPLETSHIVIDILFNIVHISHKVIFYYFLRSAIGDASARNMYWHIFFY
jgi:hypothetical protein